MPSGTLSMRATVPDDADPVELLGAAATSISGSRQATMREHAVAAEHVVDELDRALLADGERRQRVGERDGVAQREHGQHGGQRRAAPIAHLLAARPGRGDLDHEASARRIGTVARALGRADRQLHREHAVLEGRLGGVGVDVGAERDDAAERPVLDLELLVDALLLGLGRAAVAGEDQLAAADLELDLGGADAGELGAHHRARRVGGVVDVDRRRERAAAARRRPRPKTSPNSSSISRRMRSKLAKRSRSDGANVPARSGTAAGRAALARRTVAGRLRRARARARTSRGSTAIGRSVGWPK